MNNLEKEEEFINEKISLMEYIKFWLKASARAKQRGWESVSEQSKNLAVNLSKDLKSLIKKHGTGNHRMVREED